METVRLRSATGLIAPPSGVFRQVRSGADGFVASTRGGVFISRDPLPGVNGTTTVANPYHYADNDPINRTDPTGMRSQDADFIACANDPRLPGSQELQGDPYGIGNGFLAVDERASEISNCMKGRKEGGFARTAGESEASLCAKAVGAASIAGMGGSGPQAYDVLHACDAAYYWIGEAGGNYGAPADALAQSDARVWNAMRHYVWSALIGSEVESGAASIAVGTHEAAGHSCPGTARECEWDKQADRHNNALGISYGNSILLKYGDRFNWCGNFHGHPPSLCLKSFDYEGLLADVRARARQELPNGNLDLRGGCPSSSQPLTNLAPGRESIEQGC